MDSCILYLILILDSKLYDSSTSTPRIALSLPPTQTFVFCSRSVSQLLLSLTRFCLCLSLAPPLSLTQLNPFLCWDRVSLIQALPAKLKAARR